MSILADITGFAQTASAINTTIAEQVAAIRMLFEMGAEATLIGAQGDVLVDTGLLRGTGRIEITENGGDVWIDVSFGDDSATPTTYNYPSSFATSAFAPGDMPGDGYAWFVELGHMTRGGTWVAPQPYLGPNFDMNANNIMSDLHGAYG